MRTIQTLLLFAIATSLVGCSKEFTQTVSGRILNAGDSTPIARTSFQLSYEVNERLRWASYSQPFTTDEAGRFSVQFETKSSSNAGWICFPGTDPDQDCFGKYSVGLNGESSVDVGDVYAEL